MRRHKKIESVKGNEWLLTYCDLATLLLTFFVLMYAFSKVDVRKFEGFVASFQGAGIFDGGSGVMQQIAPGGEKARGIQPAAEGNASKGEALKMYEKIRGYLQEEGLSEKIDTSIQETSIEMVINERILFDSGNAVLKPEARRLLDSLSGLFAELPNQIVVEGHTDNRIINTVQYPTNWELSVDRAAKVVRYLSEECGLDPRKFIAVGYGEFSPVVPNDSPENQAMNRRVVMVIKTNEVSREVSEH